MKRLFFGIVFVVLGVGSWVYFTAREQKVYDSESAKVDADFDNQVNENRVRELINNSTLPRELEEAEELVVTLPKSRIEKLHPYIRLKKSLLYFDKAENYFKRAVEIENAVAEPPPTPTPANPNPQVTLHPLTRENLNKAIAMYELARREAEKLKEISDSEFNYDLNYLKGEICYRFLELIVEQEASQEMFNQTVTYYKQALRYKPNDINTVVNIELLIKNQNSLVSNAPSPAKKKQMLNSKKFGINKSSGN